MNDDSVAGFFISGWYVFDNFAPFQVDWRGKLYPTSEHAYQAAHFFETNPDLAEQIRLAKSPREASDIANENAELESPDWQLKKLEIMREIVSAKLEQHPYVRQTLMDSGDRLIIEMNDDDEFWGWGKNHNGQNNLGKIWMELREQAETLDKRITRTAG